VEKLRIKREYLQCRSDENNIDDDHFITDEDA
jgi:hypothetical protein